MESSTRNSIILYKTKSIILSTLGKKCSICGYNNCNGALELHHLNPKEKEFQLSGMRISKNNWESIVKELKKCILVCANCHREIHYLNKIIPENINRFNDKYENFEDVISNIDLHDKCPSCNKNKFIWKKTCSRKCSGYIYSKYNWVNFDLQKMYIEDNLSIEKISKVIGCSSTAVLRRLRFLNIKRHSKYAKINWPSDIFIQEELKNKPLLTVAKNIGCTDNALKKHIKRRKINWEFKPRGFWQKKKFNKI